MSSLFTNASPQEYILLAGFILFAIASIVHALWPRKAGNVRKKDTILGMDWRRTKASESEHRRY